MTINKIIIKNIPCFDAINGIEIKELKKINYIYGANGSGKTSISNVISNPENYRGSNLDWQDSKTLERLVYNKNFVKENFSPSEDLKGVFTLGEDNASINEQIENNNKIIKNKNEAIDGLVKSKNSQQNIINEKTASFQEKCWSEYTKYKDDFDVIFKGFKTKENFKEKCIKEINSEIDLLENNVLKDEVRRFFKETPIKKSEIPLIDYTKLKEIEEDLIWKTKILGKSDVDISDIIKKLNNSDWIKKGKEEYLKKDICPFCNQNLPVGFKEKLEDYFDETYSKQINLVLERQNSYEKEVDEILSQIFGLLQSGNDMVENNELNSLNDILTGIIKNNKLEINNKIQNPSISYILEKTEEHIKKINDLIQSANDKIRLHNRDVDNLLEKKSHFS